MNNSKLFWIDWIRFLSSLAVVLAHTMKDHYVDYNSLDFDSKSVFAYFFLFLKNGGHPAVIMFFSLSGILVGGKLIERVFSGKLNIISYFIDRAFRIYIPYIPVLFLSCFVFYSDFGFSGIFSNILGLQGICDFSYAGNGSLWTLSYEIWFYILSGSAAFLVVSRKLNLGYFACGALFCFSMIVFLRLELKFLYCFFIGSIMSFLPIDKKYSLHIVIASFCLSLMLVAIGRGAQEIDVGKFLSIKQLLFSPDSFHLYQCFVFCVLIKTLSKLDYQNCFIKSIEKLGSKMASFSYTMYLCHQPVLNFLYRTEYFGPEKYASVNLHTFFLFLSKIFLIIIVSVVLYILFEKNTDFLKIKFKNFVGLK